MHHAHRSASLLVAIVVLASLSACETHDRRIYSSRQDKNLHTPDPWAPSTSKAADDATSALGLPPEPSDSANPSAPGAPPEPMNQ